MHCNAVASSQPVSIHVNRFVGNLSVDRACLGTLASPYALYEHSHMA